jgi:hypothetical protein
VLRYYLYQLYDMFFARKLDKKKLSKKKKCLDNTITF